MKELYSWPFLGRSKPVEVTHAEGAWLYSKQGGAILDAAGGAIVANIGHGRKDIAAAIEQASSNTSYVVPTWLTPEREALIEELTSHWLPPHLTRVHLTCSGSEANEAAIKIAVQYQAARGKPEKCQVLSRSLSYHGTTITTAGVSGHASRKLGLEGILGTWPAIETPYPLRCPLGQHHPDAKDYYLKNLESVIASIGAENIAALIAEPMNGSSGGAIAPPEGYWQEALAILRKHDILLIMDEVMTGFGRMGTRFGAEFYGIEPDLLVSGKGLGGGYAAVTGTFSTDEIARTIADSPYEVMFHTFAGLPQACAAASAVLRALREENLLADVPRKGADIQQRLKEALGQHPHVAEIRGEGLLIGIEVVEDRETLKRFPIEANVTSRMVGHALDNGVFFYPGGTGEARDIVCIGAPFIIGEAEIDKMVSALVGAVKHVTGL